MLYSSRGRLACPRFCLKRKNCFALVCLYILVYVNLMQTELTTMRVSNITFHQSFDKFYAEHHETLSCPCSTVRIPYRNVTSNHVTMHSICSSIFIDPQWREALYFTNASRFGVWDFRTTAYSQVSWNTFYYLFLIVNVSNYRIII